DLGLGRANFQRMAFAEVVPGQVFLVQMHAALLLWGIFHITAARCCACAYATLAHSIRHTHGAQWLHSNQESPDETRVRHHAQELQDLV
ncbi:MAG: hypothetical protein RSB42_12125, partial [Comamonas sp.]